jgi:outer membrane protein OmpA-like peptidoglycan-associated protein
MGTGRMIISFASSRRFALGRQLALVMGLAVAAAGCSTLSELDPTGLLSDNSDTGQTSQFPADQAAPTASDQTTGTTPDLASIPSRPATSSTAAQQQTTQSLASDGAQARYSADALRGGTEAAAAPPPADAVAPTAAQRVLGSSAAPAPVSNPADLPPTAEAAPAPQMATNQPRPAAMPAPVAAPGLPEGAQPAPPPNVPVSTAAVPPSANARMAAVAPAASASPVGPSAAPRGMPAVPAVPANAPARGAMMAQPALSDAALGFRPSAAPPLSSSVNDFVSAPIVAHYRQTASNAGMASASAAVPAVPPGGAMSDASPAVVTNMAAVSGAPAAIAAMNGGVPPTAVIYFPGDGASLSAAARSQVRNAADAYKANGGQGTVRVVGHASSRTANMPVEKHLETIFDKSQARANAVAQELIHDGVPATRVLIDAVGDSQPIYYESMPEGEEGNRRAEIFVQS